MENIEKKRLFSNSQLKRLIVPLLIEQLLAMLVGMLDTIMVSAAGEAAISGVSIVNDINNLAIQLLAALAGGGSVVVAQYLGNDDRENSNLSASQLWMISFVISTSICFLCLLLHTQILQALYGSVEYDVMEAAKEYFWITALSFPFLGIYNASAAQYRIMNQTKATMYVSILMNTINLVGNYIGVNIMHLGAAGVAWPTTISRAVAGLVMSYLAFHKENPIHLVWKDILSFHKDIIQKVLSIAIPNGLETGLFQLGKILISAIVATFGTSQIAANGVTNSLSTLCYVTEMAMQLAIVTVIGRCVGANDYEQAKYYVRKMVGMAMVMAIVDNIIIYFISPYALSLYTLSNETYQIATTILMMECVAVSLLHAPAFVLPCALRASGDAKYTMIVGVTSMFIARVGCAYLIGSVMGYGVVGTRIAMYIDWVVRIAFFAWRYISNKWMEYRVVE